MPGPFDSLLGRENKLSWLFDIIKDLEYGTENLNKSAESNQL